MLMVLINHTVNILCVIIKMGKLMTYINRRPSCCENMNMLLFDLSKHTTEGKQFAILE